MVTPDKRRSHSIEFNTQKVVIRFISLKMEYKMITSGDLHGMCWHRYGSVFYSLACGSVKSSIFWNW